MLSVREVVFYVYKIKSVCTMASCAVNVCLGGDGAVSLAV